MILWRNIEIFSLFIILIPTPDFPHFYYMLGGNLGSLLYGDVSVMGNLRTCMHSIYEPRHEKTKFLRFRPDTNRDVLNFGFRM